MPEHVALSSRMGVVLLCLIAGALFVAARTAPDVVPWAAFLPLLVISGVVHRPVEHSTVVACVLTCILVGGVVLDGRSGAGASFVSGLLVATVTMWRSIARARVGVTGTKGEAILDELRTTLERRGTLPRLGRGWHLDGCISAAHGHPFSGDFIVSHYDEQQHRLEVVLVDVSGKGLLAVSRSVQLSGGLEALMGSVPPEEVLGAANDYVMRQGWEEGYATAVYLEVHLRDGRYQVWRAGHPPAAVFGHAAGGWQVLDDRVGPALGLVENPVYRSEEGVLGEHDLILLYSDGLVERTGHALDEGIVDLLDHAGVLAAQGVEGGGRQLCAVAASGDLDDRAVVLLQRDGSERVTGIEPA